MKYRVLSIDAWAGPEPDTWEWNQWHHIGTYHESEYGELTEASAMKFFNARIDGDVEAHAYIYDDQHNLVLCHKSDHRPLYAIEYGGVI